MTGARKRVRGHHYLGVFANVRDGDGHRRGELQDGGNGTGFHEEFEATCSTDFLIRNKSNLQVKSLN